MTMVKSATASAIGAAPSKVVWPDHKPVDLVDRVPEDRDRRRDDERADDERGDTLQLRVAVGVLAVGRLARKLHEDANDDVVRHVRGGVDAVGQQRGAVADDAER